MRIDEDADDDVMEVIDNASEAAAGGRSCGSGDELDAAAKGVLAELMRDDGPEEVLTRQVTIRESREIDQSTAEVELSRTGASMRSVLNAAGVTVERLATALEEGLKARKHVVVCGKGKRIPDYAIRIKYLELAHKLRGDFPSANAPEISVSYEQRLTQVMARARSLLKA